MLKLSKLSKRYDQHVAVHSLSITIPSGQIWGFLGVNGAGKSTTMKMIAGLLNPSEGFIEVNGINVHQNPLQAKKSLVTFLIGHTYMKDSVLLNTYIL